MGGRYYVTGVQLGMLKAFIKLRNPEDLSDAAKMVDRIIEDQYIGEADQTSSTSYVDDSQSGIICLGD